MILISHRGNISGPKSESENHPTYIKRALSENYDVEIDVWYKDDKFYLGHDKPQYPIDSMFFQNFKLWAHCKNIEALYKLKTNPLINAFFHDQDDAVLTSQGYIWTFPKANIPLTNQSIAVMPERVGEWPNLNLCYGICTDYVLEYQKDINFKPNLVKETEQIVSE